MRERIAKTRAACHLCGHDINYELPHTDSQSFVVDHRVPLSAGGADRPENGAAAHRECNAKKGARPHDPSVRRSHSLG
ncbi:HNH endonuclease [Rathayibacter sp. AY2B5]|uniref:HNH endonuclease n=1 Tax=Rathayibacter sp. AY2B5 TaxID=2080570 RepID=UPI0035BE7006